MADITTLEAFRTERGLTLAAAAVELGLRPTSASWLSDIENGRRDASMRLALQIEQWSGGRVPAVSICKLLVGLHPGPRAADNDATLAVGDDVGAGKNGAGFSPAGVAA